MSAELEVISDTRRLVEVADIQHIRFHRLAATVSDEIAYPLEDPGELRIVLTSASARGDGEGGWFETLFRFDVSGDSFTIEIESAIRYGLAGGPFSIDETVVEEFLGKVAVMAVFPYVREAVQDLSLRTVGFPITPPILRLGDINFQKGEAQDADGHTAASPSEG